MNFEDIVSKLNVRIVEHRTKEKAIKERFQSLRTLMDEDIELIEKCFMAGMEIPRHKEAYITNCGDAFHPRKFVYTAPLRSGDAIIDSMGIVKFNLTTVSSLAIAAGEIRKGVVFYAAGQAALHWKARGDKRAIWEMQQPEPVVDIDIIERFCDKFEEMHKELRDWLDKELA